MDINTYIDDYISWLRNKIIIGKTEEAYEITTPFLNPDNDSIQIYVQSDNDGKNISLSDDAYTINWLEAQGLSFSTKRKKLVC